MMRKEKYSCDVLTLKRSNHTSNTEIPDNKNGFFKSRTEEPASSDLSKSGKKIRVKVEILNKA